MLVRADRDVKESPTTFGEQLAERLDAVLWRPEATVDWIAIPWLHLLNQHPIHMMKYRALMLRQGAGDIARGLPRGDEALLGSRTLRRTAAMVRRGAGGIVASATGSAREGMRIPPAVASRGAADVLIVSPLVDPKHLDHDGDFYFGDLQAHLADRGISSLLVLRNTSQEPSRALHSCASRDGPMARMVLPQTMGAADELGYVRRGMVVRGQMAVIEREAPDPLALDIVREARGMALSGGTIANFRLHSQILALCRRLRPRVVIGLYEGHAVEPCLWHAARQARPSVLCVAYQHTTLWAHSHAVRRTLGHAGAYDPDVILTLGDFTRRELAASKDLRGIPLLTIGSHRHSLPAAAPDEARRRKVVLVIPEGIESECVHLFQAAIECARLAPDVRFIFRTHPILPFERIRDRLVGIEQPNVEISTAPTMQEDFARSGACFYRGSSTVLYAILAGLKPFYLRREAEVNLDPVYPLREWRETVTGADDLKIRLLAHFGGSSEDWLGEWRVAHDFCTDYVHPFRVEAVDELLAMAGAKGGV